MDPASGRSVVGEGPDRTVPASVAQALTGKDAEPDWLDVWKQLNAAGADPLSRGQEGWTAPDWMQRLEADIGALRQGAGTKAGGVTPRPTPYLDFGRMGL